MVLADFNATKSSPTIVLLKDMKMAFVRLGFKPKCFLRLCHRKMHQYAVDKSKDRWPLWIIDHAKSVGARLIIL